MGGLTIRGMKAILWVKTLPLRVQLSAIGCGYLVVLAYGAAMQYARYLAALQDPAYSSGGMWAFGDEMLAWWIFLLAMGPTFLVLLVIRQHETTYVRLSKILFWFSLTAPVCLALSVVGNLLHHASLVDPLVWRVWRGPFVLLVIGMSRILAKPDVAKRQLTRAALIEFGTLAVCMVLLMG